MSALENVLSRASRITIDANREYAGIVRRLADDEEVEASIVVDVALAAGRTLNDIEADTSRLIDRLAARADLDGQADVEAALHALGQQIARVERDRQIAIRDLEREHAAKLGQLNSEFDDKAKPLQGRSSACSDRLAAAHRGRQLLLNTAAPKLQSRLAELQAALAEAESLRASRAAEIQLRISYVDNLLEGGIPPERDEVKYPFAPDLDGERARKREKQAREVRITQVANLERECLRHLAELERLEAAPQQIAKQIAEIVAEMLQA